MTNDTGESGSIPSLPRLIRSIPRECLTPSTWRSCGFLLRDFVLIFLSAALVLYVDSWILGPFAAVLLGLSISGLFSIGHDCGHRSFSKNRAINDFVGHIVTSPLLWPFHVWRLDHDEHHRHTAHVDRDTAWRPVTFRLWQRMPRVNRLIYLWTRKYFFFLGSFYTTYTNVKEGLGAKSSKKFNDDERRLVARSMIVMFVMAGLYLGLSVWAAGLYGFVCLFLIPQIVFQSLLSTFTFFHHTSPDVLFHDKRSWRPEVAQLCNTLHVNYPGWLEFFTHDINWHVPHHVCVGIPHYHLRQAHGALRDQYAVHVKEVDLTFGYMRRVTSQCHFIASKNPVDHRWVSHAEALAKESTRQQTIAARSKAQPAL